MPTPQTIYVAKDGALSFTAPYEAEVDLASIAYPSGFACSYSYYYSHNNSSDASASTRTSESRSGPGLGSGVFTFSGTESEGWVACAVAGAWRVYADLKSVEASGKGNGTGCVGFEARWVGYGGLRVWEYV